MSMRFTSLIKPPIQARFRRNDQWEWVEVIAAVYETGGVYKNVIRFKDGKELEVNNNLLNFDGDRGDHDGSD